MCRGFGICADTWEVQHHGISSLDMWLEIECLFILFPPLSLCLLFLCSTGKLAKKKKKWQKKG